LYSGTQPPPPWLPGTGPVPSSSNPSNLTALGNTVFFTATDATHGLALWKSNGHDTVMVHPFVSVAQVVAFNGKIYLSADDGTTGLELWVSDGTTKGTRLVKDLFPGTTTITPPFLPFPPGPAPGPITVPNGSVPYGFMAVGGTLYFAA